LSQKHIGRHSVIISWTCCQLSKGPTFWRLAIWYHFLSNSCSIAQTVRTEIKDASVGECLTRSNTLILMDFVTRRLTHTRVFRYSYALMQSRVRLRHSLMDFFKGACRSNGCISHISGPKAYTFVRFCGPYCFIFLIRLFVLPLFPLCPGSVA